jgi:hypothetical protein
MAADFYVGDVSSQVFEFLIKPRPCIFLNPRHVTWTNDPDYDSWRLGKVVTSLTELDEALASVAEWQPAYLARQTEARNTAFPESTEPAPVLGAQAISKYLRHGHVEIG